MLKKIALSAAALTLATGLAFAQNQVAPTPSRPGTMGRSVAAPPSSLSTTHWLASDIYKASVYDSAENKIGDVSDLVIDKDGTINTAVIGVGGFLGAGEKDVAVPFKNLKVESRNGKNWLVLNMTKDELKNAPAYDKTMGNKM